MVDLIRKLRSRVDQRVTQELVAEELSDFSITVVTVLSLNNS